MPARSSGPSDGDPLVAYSGSFRYDILPLAVTSTLPAVGSIVTLPFTTLDVNFNEAVKAGSVEASDFASTWAASPVPRLLDADTFG